MIGPSRGWAGKASALAGLFREALAHPDKRGFLRSLSNTYGSNYINLSLVFRGELSDRRVRRIALSAVLHYLYNAAHYAAPAFWPGFRVEDAPAAEGVGPGQGVLFACQHVGPQRFAFVEVAARGWRVNAAMSEAFVERAQAWLADMRRAARGSPMEAALERVRLLPPVEHPDGPQEMVRALRRGEAVMFDVDGNTGVGGREATFEEGLPLRFLGRDVHVRTGIARLAFRTGVPIVPLLARWRALRAPELRFSPAIRPEPGEDVDAFSRRALGALYGLLERALREDPAQWEMWSQLARWQRPAEKLDAQALTRAALRGHVQELRSRAERAPETWLQVPPQQAHVARVRGRHVLVDPRGFRFFVVPARRAALLERLHRGARLGALVRTSPGDDVVEDLARLRALGALELPAADAATDSSERGANMPASTTSVRVRPEVTPETLVGVLRARAAERPDDVAFISLGDDDCETRLTFGVLDRRARALAVELQRRFGAGARALLLFPPGLDFIVGFFGCLYSGVLAVPCPLPERGRGDRIGGRLRGIVEDAGIAGVLTVAESLASVREVVAEGFSGLPEGGCIALEELDLDAADAWVPPPVRASDVAFLQYTSGSTATPKGVMVTHGNLMHNVEALYQVQRCDASSIQLNWLPQFHDAGLVHGILHPVYAGIPCIRMSPLAVVKHPARWLRAVQRYRVTHTGGPNFAYELCVRRVGPEGRRGLDLSSLRCLYSAAEPIRAATLEAFFEAFAGSGLPAEAFFPAYGLAEATLIVTSANAGEGWRSRLVEAATLDQAGTATPAGPGARARRLVSSGRAVPGTTVHIVDPERRVPVLPRQVGEIWVAGPSVASGYWANAEATEATFRARLTGSPDTFLRTGDLGFMDEDGETFVTGRIKDVVIARGRNVYPQDVEETVERCHPALRPNCGAAFAVEAEDEEAMVVVQEATPSRVGDGQAIFQAILRALAEEHDLCPDAIVLVAPRSVPKTSSGKIQRRACREAYRASRFTVLAGWGRDVRSRQQSPSPALRPVAAASGPASTARADAMIGWLRGYAEERINSRLIDERRCIPPFLVLDMAHHGFMGMLAPEAYGGGAFAAADFARVLEQMGAIDLTLASFASAHNVLGVRPIARHASERARAEHLPLLAAGRQLGAFAATEEGAGANLRAMESVAVDDGRGGWLLRGKKIWSGSSSWAGAINVVVRQAGVAGAPEGYSAFVVPQGARGLRFGPEEITLGLRGMVQNSVLLEDVPVGSEAVLGQVGQGMEVAQDTFGFGRFSVAAVAVGVMKRCAQLALRYTGRRSVATGLLLHNPVVLARLSDLTAAIDGLECLVRGVAPLMDDAGPLSIDAAIACKILGAELAWRSADDLVQMLGGRGYVETNVAPQILRDVRILRIFEGPTEALEAFLGARAVHDLAELRELLRRHFESPAVEGALAEALERVRGVVGEPRTGDARLRLQHAAGAVACQAILWAAVEQAARRRPALARSARWARRRFESAVEGALRAAQVRDLELSPHEIEDAVAGYTANVGDVEQRHAGERWSLDPMLARGDRQAEPEERPAAAVPPVIVAVPSAPEPTREPEPEPDRIVAVDHEYENIRGFVVQWLADQNGLDSRTIDAAAPLASLGLDSITAVLLVDDLEKRLGRPLRADLAWSHSSIEALARHLASESAVEAPAAVA